jgi:hypothetical protein
MRRDFCFLFFTVPAVIPVATTLVVVTVLANTLVAVIFVAVTP